MKKTDMETEKQIEGNIDKKNVKHKHGSQRTEMEVTNQKKSNTPISHKNSTTAPTRKK